MSEPQPNRRDPSHDGSYKLLYSHAAMVRDLLRGFIPGEWLAQLDLGTLEQQSSSYVSDDLRDRADDIIWRVRWGREWLYIYVLLEFQSSIDHWMAVRIPTYIGLLYQDLIRAETVKVGDQLPPVLPVVLYNGASPWNAETSLEPLVAQGPRILRPFCLQSGYLLLDERRIAEKGNLPTRNLCTALFQLEASRGVKQALAILQPLIAWLSAPEHVSLRRAFAQWFARVFLPRRLPGALFPSFNDLAEVYTMITDNVDSWADQWEQQGIEKGIEKGIPTGTRRVLVRQIHRRFGEGAAEQSKPLLEQIAEAQRLEDLAEELLLCTDAEAWLVALHTAAEQ
jgi:hypothetical protein